MKVVIFPNDSDTISIVRPNYKDFLTEQEAIDVIKFRDVPKDIPYLIIEETDLPETKMFRSFWQADFSNPDGYGIGHKAWFELIQDKQSLEYIRQWEIETYGKELDD